MSWRWQPVPAAASSAPTVVYKGAAGKTVVYKGARTDAQVYLGAKQLWP